jgi:hypothetical protein
MTKKRAMLFVARVLLACLVVVDCFILLNVGIRFVVGGPRGVTGYYEHIALEGVNVFAIDPAQARQMVIRSTLHILIVYGALAVATILLSWAVRRLKGGSPARVAAPL